MFMHGCKQSQTYRLAGSLSLQALPSVIPQLENSSSNDTVAYSDQTCPGPLPPKTAQPPACMTQGVAFLSAGALSRALLPVAVIGRFVLTNQKLSTQTESTIYKLFRSPLGELLNNSHFHWVSSTTNV